MKNRRIYVLNQRQEETYDAAGKAMRDIFSILREMNARVIWSVPKKAGKFLKAFDLPYLFFFLLFFAGKRDFVFYSIPENHIRIKLLKKIQAVKKYQMICFINDLNAFRYGSFTGAEEKKELEAVSAADHVLIPNRSTEKLLCGAGVSGHLVPVGIWDYLMTEKQAKAVSEKGGQFRRKQEGEIRIAFAGNLNKSEFLSVMELPDGISMELWGKLEEEREKKLPAGCHYHGVLPSEEVPLAICTMDYGLVWDGTGADDIEGGLGEYLRYNNSHKCALYLAAGLPVIVWSRSGMAGFVNEYHCGITIDKLSDLKKMTAAADYQTLRSNARKMMALLQQGYFFKKAINSIYEK